MLPTCGAMKLTLKGTVIKMKNICRSTIAVILAFVCIISFAGCVKDGGAKPGDGTTTAEPATTQDPKFAAIEKIKKEAVELVNDDSDDKDSADELFAAFCGDYVVDNIKQTNGLRRVVRKGDAAFTEYADGSGLYVVARDGVVYYVESSEGKYSVGNAVEPGSSNEYLPSVFFDFSMDISDLYSGNKDDASGNMTNMPKLTEDMVTVDDDMKTAVFSESYLNDVIKSIADFFAADNEAAGKEFLASAEITGKYYVEEKRAELVLKYKTEATGDVIMTIGQKNDAEKGPVGLLKTEWTVVMNGISMPTVSELTVYGVKYDGKKPVCGTFEIATTTGASFDYQGYKGTVSMKQSASYKLDTRANAKLNCDAESVVESVTVIGGNTERVNVKNTLVIEGGNIAYSMTSNGSTYAVNGKIRLGTSDDMKIPAGVDSCIDQYIKETSGV